MTDVKSVPQNNGKACQFLATLIVNLLGISTGISCGWPSPVIPQLRSSNPPVGDAPMTEDQISWITSLMAIGGLITTPFCGSLVERIGRKKFALLSGLPHMVSWLLIIFGSNHLYLYAARLAIGMANAMTFFIVPLYVSEIASKDIRGRLGSLAPFLVNTGTLFAYVAGAFLSYRLFANIALIFSLGFVAIFGFMPETPVYLVRRNLSIQARNSLMFLRGNNEALVEREITKLRSQAKTFDTLSKKINLREFFSDRATRRGLMISLGLFAIQPLSGIFAMISYAETIFQRAGSSFSAETASIIIALIQIFGSYISIMLIDRAGRRLLTLISCFGMTVSHTIVGLFFYLQLNHHDVSSISWLPLVALSIYMITFYLGMGPVPPVFASEVFRLHVSSFAINICYIFFWAMTFTSIQTFDSATQLLGDDGCFFMLAIFCAASFVFIYCLLLETKGRDRQDIVDELAGIGSSHNVTGDDDKCAEIDGLMTKPV